MKITLAWITSQGKNYNTFVENRVREIRQNASISRCFYCESKNNPADLLTRCKHFVCVQQNNILWGDGTFSSETNFQHSQSNESSIDNDVFLHELKTSALEKWSQLQKQKLLLISTNLILF